MEKGQLGTQVQRRIIFIWEGVLAELPDHRAVHQLEWIDRQLGRWDTAVSRWEINHNALNWMWAILARTEFRVDVVVTTRPPSFSQALAKLSDRNNWPIRYIANETAQGLGRLLPAMPDIDRVYYGREDQRWAYGPHGVHFPTAGQIV
jgi:hypothetical protein